MHLPKAASHPAPKADFTDLLSKHRGTFVFSLPLDPDQRYQPVLPDTLRDNDDFGERAVSLCPTPL